jgi:hypothetical protein
MIFPREKRPVPQSAWAALSTEAAAICHAIISSGLQDKSIAIETGIDPATLSKARTGMARLNDDDLNALMDVTGSEAPLYALLLRRGYDPSSLRPLETETQRKLREAEEKLQRQEAEHAIAMRAMRELLLQPQAA